MLKLLRSLFLWKNTRTTNNAEENDLNDVLQKVGNVTKIVTLIDNVEQQNIQPGVQPSSFTSPMVGNGSTNNLPNDETPVAIDTDNPEPNATIQQ